MDSRTRWCLSVALAGLFALLANSVHAQAFYFVSKTQGFFQTSTAAPVADPSQPFRFSAQAATNVTFTLPGGGTQAIPFDSSNGDYQFDQTFTTKAAMDAAFPNGAYRMTGSGIPTLNFNFNAELYPNDTPTITGGTWSNGLLVIDPTQAATITFNTFSGYASSGVGGHMETRVQSMNDNSVNLQNQIATQAIAGLPASSTPLTSISIPARTLTSGRVYQASIQFDTLSTLDTTSLTGGGLAVGLWSKALNFYVVAQAPGTTSPPIAITGQPANVAVVLGGRATFNIGFTVGGQQPNQNSNVSIIWSFNGQQINFDGTKYQFNGGSLVVNNVTNADVGSYTVTLIGPGGIVTSSAASLTLAVATAPTIARQPASITVAQGTTAVLSVAASGLPAPTYQWKLNGNNVTGLAGANGPTLSIPGASAAQAGTYTVVVTNSIGTVTSNSATLTVSNNVTDPGRLINLSILTPLAAGESMTMGTVLGGAGTSGNKPLLARAVGPSLTAFGINAFLPNPSLTLNFTTPTPAVVVANNTVWGGSATLSNAFASVGAFALASTTSKDSAIFQSSLQPGNYTVQVSDATGGSGTVIAELYDATASTSFTNTTPRLINVSVLKQIGTGSSLTAGFVIGGSAAKSVLIRAIGPGLASVGVTGGTMVDPTLTLNSTSVSPAVVVAANNDWGGDPAISATAQRVGAFAVNNGASKDAMLLVTLAPGQYTAQVAPASGTAGGTAIVEVYEVP